MRVPRCGPLLLVLAVLLCYQAYILPGDDGRRLQKGVMFHYHKDLFPLNLADVLCFFVAGCSLLVASGGGVGGGGILVPLYMLFLRFRPRHAVALSSFTILGGALANTVVNLLRTDTHGQSLIDWNIIVMMEPATIAGTIVGSYFSKYLPDFVLMVFLSIVLAILAFRTLDKGLEMFYHENEHADEIQVPQEDASEEEDVKESRNLVGHSVRRVERDPWMKVALLISCFLGCIVLTVLKGSGEGSIVGVACGSASFWLLTWATLPWVMGFGLIFREILMREHLENEEDGHDYQLAEIQWTAVTTIRYPLLCSLAGVFAGLFGVGGGIIKGPLMLELGVDPQVASATAATMILFTSGAASVSFQVFGLLQSDYAALCFMMGFSCTLLGQYFIQRYLQGALRQSLPVLSMGFVMALSTLLLGLEIFGHLSQKNFQELIVPTSLCNTNS